MCFCNYRITEALLKADRKVLFKGSNGSVNASFFTLTLSLGALFRRLNFRMQWHIVIPLYSSLVFQREKKIVCEVQSINQHFIFFPTKESSRGKDESRKTDNLTKTTDGFCGNLKVRRSASKIAWCVAGFKHQGKIYDNSVGENCRTRCNF